jgi:hypothetical protein
MMHALDGIDSALSCGEGNESATCIKKPRGEERYSQHTVNSCLLHGMLNMRKTKTRREVVSSSLSSNILGGGDTLEHNNNQPPACQKKKIGNTRIETRANIVVGVYDKIRSVKKKKNENIKKGKTTRDFRQVSKKNFKYHSLLYPRVIVLPELNMPLWNNSKHVSSPPSQSTRLFLNKLLSSEISNRYFFRGSLITILPDRHSTFCFVSFFKFHTRYKVKKYKPLLWLLASRRTVHSSICPY